MPGRGVRPPGCQGLSSVGESPAYWRREERHGRLPAVRSLMVGIRQPPLLWGNQLSSKEPGDVGEPSSLAQKDSGGTPAGRGASGGLPEDALGKDPPRWGQGVCVDGCHPGRGRLVPAWQDE